MWVIQAYVLLEYFALYSCRDDLFRKALSIHRNLVDAAREFQMLQDGVTLHGQGSGASPGRTDDTFAGFLAGFLSTQDPGSEEKRWSDFIEQESQKRYASHTTG